MTATLLTSRGYTDTLLRTLWKPGPGYLALLSACVLLVAAGIYAWHYQAVNGMGMAMQNSPAGWCIYITNFVFWVGIAHAGTAISAILYLLRTRWRTAIFRLSEAMTVFAVMTAGLFPLIHIGRVWVFYYLLPYPNQRHLWPNFKSPLGWDMLAVLTYFTISVLFLFSGMIPDFAVMRDRLKGWRKRIYGALSLGWRGSDRQWGNFRKSYTIFAGLATPLVISVHSVVSWDFAMSIVPGWHSTIFAPYFVAGALHSGFATVLVLLIPLRRIFKVEHIITVRHLEQTAKAAIFTGLIVGYAYIVEFFLAWYSADRTELSTFDYFATGHYAPFYWIMVIFNAIVPLAFFAKRVRTSIFWLFVIGLAIDVGMWAERYLIIVASLSHDYVPHQWNTVYPRWVDITITAASLGWWLMWILLFVKLMPWISVSELREELVHEKAEPAEERS